MVVTLQEQDIFELCSNTINLNLPKCKPNGLNILYKNVRGVSETIYKGEKSIPLPFAETNVFQAPISEWRRLTARSSDCKSVYEITFDIKGSNFKFKPGDTIGIIPQNNETEVNSILEHLGLSEKADLNYELTVNKDVKGAKVPLHIPTESTLRHVFTHCVDIRCVIKKQFLLALSTYTKDDKEIRVLEYLCSKEGSATYNSYILEKNTSLIDIFHTFKSCQPPIEIILANLPRLLPRPYSVANSQLYDENKLKICFSVIELSNNRKGLTTEFLEKIILNDNIEKRLQNLSINEMERNKVSIYMRKNINGFVLPDIRENLILIGPGTGVAPFIAFLEERLLIKEKEPTIALGDVWLFFGCRNPKLDYLYEDKINNFRKKHVLTRFNPAFSRLEECETKYVQDAISKHQKDVAEFIKSGAKIFVCGDLKSMSKEVREALKQCLIADNSQSEMDAEIYIVEMEKNKKYIVDIWS